ncbi:DinB family protein [Bacillus sp. 31A1R]|uniref:DinB family protein n=1 Tax=Robertmurraya mangrovi TaxID=3098077 RepID=A0ABU5IYI2_9BACI|nr:DinB family protein [Bacillus sp. 31A1R]MDZ5472230.1 DinB family protein [Bacillus sp. 31A1R]
MNAIDLFLLDFKESRRRFIMTATAFPSEFFTWKPDKDALSVGETIRHVLLHDFSWLKIFEENRLPTAEETDHLWAEPYTNLQDEIIRSNIYHDQFITYVSSLQTNDLDSKYIQWPHKPIRRTLGDALERKSYHDAVHTGQLLQYLRMLNIERPMIWD